MPDTVINHITCICKNFLWIGNTARTKSALVAWKHICLPKDEGGLGLYDIKVRNLCFITKQLWNIHLKIDLIWIRLVHHFYLQDSSIWLVPL
jgi:hypothetical protein